MMKVRLLNDGGFKFLEDVIFPVQVDALEHPCIDGAVHVSSHQLISIGATRNVSMLDNWSFHGDEFEVVDE